MHCSFLCIYTKERMHWISWIYEFIIYQILKVFYYLFYFSNSPPPPIPVTNILAYLIAGYCPVVFFFFLLLFSFFLFFSPSFLLCLSTLYPPYHQLYSIFISVPLKFPSAVFKILLSASDIIFEHWKFILVVFYVYHFSPRYIFL